MFFLFYFWGDELGWGSAKDKLLVGGAILSVPFFSPWRLPVGVH
ncbi:hypothetical protein ymoll0001_31520 [Yersinia mollaretii ATCC 43969]|uniref:Uncharacterized protein n=1 Tax=Yersinia mollaretii (strain ATCC 43969 / DSM 18520 / CIP 103324 / CNY 7263 / WAIP 204) TaxID=349967 RepID=A0ABP2EF19_YERMW|nr:hypothetical protein ymoll0001_31520 [Yersinia mollaretii ATCC 43969]